MKTSPSNGNRLLAIDPGNELSGAVIIDTASFRPLECAKIENERLEDYLSISDGFDEVVIEMVASYGMAVGATVFETCVAIGRFERILDSRFVDHDRLFRREVKRNICGVVSAKDANVIQALVDRFAYGEPNRGKGTAKAPGWFYGFKADIWQAYALAVTYEDLRRERRCQRATSS